MTTTETVDTLSAAYAAAVQAHKTQNGAAARCVLDVCRVVHDAKTTLSDTDWAYFLRRNDLSGRKAASRLSAMVRIGKAFDLFTPIADALPASLTSLSLLATHTNTDVLNDWIASGSIHPLMTVLDAEGLRDDRGTRAQRGRPSRQVGAPVESPESTDDAEDTMEFSFDSEADPDVEDAAEAVTVAEPLVIAADDVLPARKTKAVPTTARPKNYRLSIDFYTGRFEPAKAATFVRALKAYVAKHAETYGLVPELVLSADLDVAVMEAEDVRAAAA